MTALILTILLFAQSAGELYQQALVQENGAGNLQKAIELYERAAKEAKDDRTMAALALEGAARTREKLGLAGRRDGNPVVDGQLASLSKELAGLQREYETMSAKYTPQHPQMQALVQRIGEISRIFQ